MSAPGTQPTRYTKFQYRREPLRAGSSSSQPGSLSASVCSVEHSQRRLALGQRAVTFEPCGGGPQRTQFNGGVIVTEPMCLPVDIAPRQSPHSPDRSALGRRVRDDQRVMSNLGYWSKRTTEGVSESIRQGYGLQAVKRRLLRRDPES